MTSQKNLSRQFAAGKTSGKASNMEITELDDGRTAIIGYGWAIYATREDGKIYVFEDWGEWSSTRGGRATKHQIGQIKSGLRSYFNARPGENYDFHALVESAEGTPRIGSAPSSVDLIGTPDRISR